MTKVYRISLCLIILIVIQACSSDKTSNAPAPPKEQLPEAYGVYANTDKGLFRLPGQPIVIKYNEWLVWRCAGLENLSNVKSKSVSDFIIYDKEIIIRNLTLSKLELKKDMTLRQMGCMRSDTMQIKNANLWSAAQNIDFDVIPIEEKRDMYRLKPTDKISSGIYAIIYGDMNSCGLSFDDPKAYDITITPD